MGSLEHAKSPRDPIRRRASYKFHDADEGFDRSSPLPTTFLIHQQVMSQQYKEHNSSHAELDKVDAEQLEHSSNHGMPVLADGSPYIPDTDEEKRLVRKIDKRLMPMLWVMYVMNYIDRTNIGVSDSAYFQQFVLIC
jgi:hypothetical protein